MSIEIIERAVARLEELKADAVQLPWSFTDQSPSMDGRNWLIRTDGVAGIKMSGHDYGYRNNVELIVALSRTVDPLIAMHRRSLLSMKAAIGAGMSEADVNEIAERSGEVALARAVLGEVSR